MLSQGSPSPEKDVPGRALQAAEEFVTGSNALAEVLRDLEQERARSLGVSRAVALALNAALHVRDGYGEDHAEAVRLLAIAIGVRLGMGRIELADLSAAALLRDIGKVSVVDFVLGKPGPLDDREWSDMREHPVMGEKILSGVPGLERVALAVRHARERWDGSGYPDALRGEQIPRASRIVAASAAWHALTADRPYRPAMPEHDALAELRRATGTDFDPVVVEALAQVVTQPEVGPIPIADGGPLAGGVDAGIERELIGLISVATAVGGAGRLDDVLEAAAESACSAVGASTVSIERWLPANRILRTLVNVGQLGRGEVRRPSDEIYEVTGDSVLIHVLENGGTHCCSLDDPDLPEIERALLESLGKHYCVAVPIVFDGACWGQIWATRTNNQPPFGDRDARFLHAISFQIGTGIRRAEMFAQLTDLARTDGLTGLGNRRAFDERLDLAHIESRSAGSNLALAMLDLDNLKEINDHKGHEAGDDAIRAAASGLALAAHDHDGAQVFRVGGDEFCVLMPRAGDAEARALAQRIVRELAEQDAPIGISCGIATLAGGKGRPADLLRAADAAQYAAKRAGRGRIFVSGLIGEDAVSHLLHEDARSNRRALRGAGGAEIGGLISEILGQLDGVLAAEPVEARVSAVLTRCGEAIDAQCWAVTFSRANAKPRTLAVTGRPGALRGRRRRSAALEPDDVETLHGSHGLAPGAPAIVFDACDPALGDDLVKRLHKRGATELLVAAFAVEWGAWTVEMIADKRSDPPSVIEPVLRLLIPQALRSQAPSPAPLGLVQG